MYTQFGPRGGGGERLVMSVCGWVSSRGEEGMPDTSKCTDGGTDRPTGLDRVLRGLSR